MNSFFSKIKSLTRSTPSVELLWYMEYLRMAETLEDRRTTLSMLDIALKEILRDDLELNRAWAAMKATYLQSNYFAHHTATIDLGCKIGNDTKIWHNTHVMKSAVIGDRCILGQNTFVAPNVVLGNGTKVQNNVSLYEGVRCEEDTFIGPSVVFTNVINPRSAIERKAEFMPTLVKKGASIGANSTIVCGHTIGAYAFVGAGSLVTSSVPDNAMVYGHPARLQYWVSDAGHRLAFDGDKAVCPATGVEYIKETDRSIKKIS